MKQKILKEYYTPDRIEDDELELDWHDDCFPFLSTKSGNIIFGDTGDKHSEMRFRLIGDYLGYNYKLVRDIYDERYYQKTDEDGNDLPIFIVGDDDIEISADVFDEIYEWTDGDSCGNVYQLADKFGRVWPNYGEWGESYISLWLNNRLDDSEESFVTHDSGEGTSQFDIDNSDETCWSVDYVPSKLDDETINLLKRVFDKFDCDLDESYICIGNTMMCITDVLNGDSQFEISQDDIKKSQEERAIHNMPAELKKQQPQIQNFLKNRGEVQGQKLGNMTMAQYHNLIYQENVKKKFNTILENISKNYNPDKILD